MSKLTFYTIFGGVLLAPFFVLAQTSTTTAVQPETIDMTASSAHSEADKLLQTFLNEKMKSIPKITDIRTKAMSDNLNIKTIPTNPGPSEMVHITVESYLTDLNKAIITWSINGKVIKKGIGERTFSFQNGPSGKNTRLTITITTNTGQNFTKELSWNPFGLTILWEADTYTPPFYKGKALLSSQSNVRAVALPDDTSGTKNALNAGNLVYVWEKDGTVVSDASGYGKNSFSFRAPKPYEDANVKVRASSINDAIKSETLVNISLSKPFILFYEKHPLLGVWYNRPFDADVTLTRKELSVSAEPYFFSNETSEIPLLKYDWSVNGNTVQSYGHIITLRNDTGGKGNSAISLSIHGLRQTFQSAIQDLMVHFTTVDNVANALF